MSIYGAQHLANAFRTVRKNTLQIAEEIPESRYEFEPADGVRTVRELLAHIAITPRLWLDIHQTKKLTDLNGYDFLAVRDEMITEQKKMRTKSEIIELLQTEGEKFATFLDGLSDEFLAQEMILPFGQGTRTRLEGLMSAKEHEMHHRGQLMLIERMVGIVPHLTRQFNERIAELEKSKAAVAQPA